MLTVFAFAQTRPGKEKELEEALLTLVAHTRQETGCINYDLHRHLDQPGKFAFYENWVDKAALEQHRASPHMLRLSVQKRVSFSMGRWKSNCWRWSPSKW
ncbi:MAG: putative quinol monooxygenase [Desulfomonilaceae bacterium]